MNRVFSFDVTCGLHFILLRVLEMGGDGVRMLGEGKICNAYYNKYGVKVFNVFSYSNSS